MGQSINDGHLPYVQLWDLKPPLAFLFFAIATLVWKSIIAVRIAGTLCVFAIAYFVFRIGEYIWESKAGLFAAVLSILFVSVSDAGQATMTEIIALVPIMEALVLLVTREMNWVTCLMTGFLLSLATLVRLNLAYLAAAVGILIFYLSLFGSRSFVKQTAAYVLGGLLPFGAVALPYFIGGYQELFVASVFKASWQYTRLPSQSRQKSV
jgi:4-amino-4-deoxy-L-arabinose transferase-like glycosyltransferase